jgi:arylsulfatase A-like enzyme
MGSAGPLRGGKGTMWEGGIRVPFILSWPGVLPEGVVNDTPVSSLDFLPTFCAAAGISLPETGIYDGTNLLPYLTHEDRSPGRKIIWFARGRYIVREGDWKLLPSASSQCNTGYWMAGGGSSCWWL